MQGALAPGYELYKNELTKAMYKVPQGSEIGSFRLAIEDLPGHDRPEIYGLHANADLTFRSLQVQAAIQLILETRPADTAALNGISKEESVDKICEDLLAKVWYNLLLHLDILTSQKQVV